MPITERQVELRKSHLGSSDAAAILGQSPWATPYDVWLEKTAELTPDKPTEAMNVGNWLEPAIINAAIERLQPAEARRNVRRVHANKVMAANLDCQIRFAGNQGDPRDVFIPLEVKTSSEPDVWGKEVDGLDGVPFQYAVQVLHQMYVVGAVRGFLAALLFSRHPELRVYEIVPDMATLEALAAKEVEWWNTHVVGGVPPEKSAPAIDTLARLVRVPGKVVDIAPTLIEDYVAAKAKLKEAEVEEADAKAMMLAALGDAEEGVSEAGTISYKLQKRGAYEVKASEFRVCRVKAAKGGAS